MGRPHLLIAASMLCMVSACTPSARDPTGGVALPEPVQVDHVPAPVADGMMGLATFSGRVLVLSRHDYPTRRDDPLSAVSPTDLAVAWGSSARPDVLGVVKLFQANRRYAWRVRSAEMARPEVRDFTRHSGNWHMIPATPEVAEALKRVGKDDVVRIEGELVQVTFDDGVYFRSSMTRDDTDDGACEIIRVRSIVIERA